MTATKTLGLTGSSWAIPGWGSGTDVLSAVGPQRPADPPLMRRARFHQSWYRAAVLGLPNFGATAGPNGRPLGSILTDSDANKGLNFTSSAAHHLYLGRRAQGWGVDPTRCTKYLTSSQALTLNIFGALRMSEQWSVDVLNSLTGRHDITKVETVEVEFAPQRRSEHLGDMTRIDALFRVRTGSGVEIVAFEIKYTDRFNSRRVNILTPAYCALAQGVPLWINPEATLASTETNQLVRCHALAASVGVAEGVTVPPTVIVIHHADDKHAVSVSSAFRELLHEPERFVSIDLVRMFEVMTDVASGPLQVNAAWRLSERYADDTGSEALWRQHLALVRT